MTDPNLRCQVANTMVDALPPILDGTCISDIATDMADVMLSTAAELVPRSKRPRGAQGWCAGPGVEAEMNAAWQQREEARRHLRAEPHNSNLGNAVKMAGKNLRKVRKAAVLSLFWDFVRKLETRIREGDQADFYKHLKTMNLEGKRDRSSAYVKDENGVLLRTVELIRKRWVRWLHTLPNAKSPRLDPNIAEGLDQGIMDALKHLRKKRGTGGREEATAGESVLATPLWGMLYADDAGVASQSPEQLRKMMRVIVVVCAVFGLTVSEAKTEIMCLRAKGMPESSATFSVEAAGQVYNQTNEFVYLGGNVNHNADLSIEVDRRIRNAWCSFRKYTLELYDRPSAPLELKIRMLRAEVLETMLYGCVTWGPRACHYDTLRRAHHRFLTRCIGWRKHNRAAHPISYLDTLTKTGSESIEATLRRRRILFAGFVARIEDTRLPECVMFGETVGDAGCAGGQEKEWMGCSLDDLRAFGINADQWTTEAQDEGEWRRTAEQGAEHFMAKWIVAEKAKSGLRHAVVRPNVTGRTKERIAQSKRARAGSLALID